MTARFLTTLDPAPKGFERRRPSRGDLLAGPVVVLAPDADAIVQTVDNAAERVQGAVVVPADAFDRRQVGELLWRLEVPPGWLDALTDILGPMLDVLGATQKVHDDRVYYERALSRTDRDLEIFQEDYNRVTGKLLNQLQSLRNTQEELRASKHRLRQVIDLMPQYIYATASDGRLILANRSFAASFGCEVDDLLGRTETDLELPTAWREASHAANARVHAEGVRVELPEQRIEIASEPRFLALTKIPFTVAGEDGTAVLSIATDVTERKHSELELERRVEARTAELATANEALREAKEAAESANQAKSLFLATVTHEVRTPLNGVIGMLELLQESPLDDDQGGMVDTMGRSAFTLLAIVDDILDFSKIEAGKMALERVPVALADVIENVTYTLKPTADGRGLRLVSDIADDLPGWVMGDPVRLRQILFNLCSNAIKFTENSRSVPGEVRVSAEWLAHDGECSDNDNEATIRLRVVDNGIGIAPEVQARLFAPFTQGEASTTRRYGGTGLGLSICERLVHMMGGEIRMDSTPGQGTAFEIDLPLAVAHSYAHGTPTGRHAPDSPDPPAAISADDARGGDRQVLVVDDNPVNREVLERQLRFHGYAPVVVSNAHEAVERWRQATFSLVMTDCRMPGIDGFELARHLRADAERGAHVPIIGVTANAMRGHVEEQCLGAGMDDYLEKPIDLHNLARVLRKWRDRMPGAEATPPSAAAADGNRNDRDPELLAGLDALVGPDHDAQQRLVTSYLKHGPEALARLEAACHYRDAATVEREAHGLKAAAESLGGEAIGSLCTQLETAASKNDWSRIVAALDELDARHAAFCQRLQRVVRGRSGARG